MLFDATLAPEVLSNPIDRGPREAWLEQRDLIDRARAGEPDAERSLYDANVDRIYRLIYRMTSSSDLAEEYTQDAFLRAFDRLEGFRGEAAFSSWLHTIAVSVTINGLRKLKRRRLHEVAVEALPETDSTASSGRPDLQWRLKEAIDRLPEILRWVFVMYEIEGYRHREIGEILRIPENTSKARLFRARQTLRQALGRFVESDGMDAFNMTEGAPRGR